jgi:hypothetical protein
MGPRTQHCGFGKQASDCLVSIMSTLPDLLPVRDICAFAQPVVGCCPTPGMLPISEPIIPCWITDAPNDSADKSRNHCPELRLYKLTHLLVTPGLFNLPDLLVSFAISCDVTLFDGLNQQRNDGMRIVEVSCGHDLAQTRCDLFCS